MKFVGDRYVDENRRDDAQPRAAEVVADGTERAPAKVNRWLAVALAAAVLVAGALGGWLYLDHRQTVDERAVVELVAANTAAWEAGDGTAVLATMTKDATWVAESGTTSEIGNGPFSGAQLADFVRRMHEMALSVETTGPLAVLRAGNRWTAVQPVRITYNLDLGNETISMTEDGIRLFVVVDTDGDMLIRHESWFPEGH